MRGLIVFVGLLTIVSAVATNHRLDTDVGKHATGNEIDQKRLKNHNKRPTKDQHIFRLTQLSEFKSRGPSLQADANFHRVEKYSICNTNSEGNSKMNKAGNTYSGSKSYTYSEKASDLQKLVCKTKAFRVVKNNGVIKRVAVDGSSVLSNDKHPLINLNNPHASNPKRLQVASVGHSSMSDSAARNDAASIINTEVKDAKASITSKSRKRPGMLETVGSAEGKAILDEGAKGVQSWGKEETRLSTNPRYDVRNPSGRSSGYSLARLSHKKKTDFQIEI